MELANTEYVSNPLKTTLKVLSKTIVAIGMFLWAFGESAGRARAAAELSRQGYHKEAKALMLESNR
jgi:hypothetical protein